jgi:hypothetical protein
MGIVFNPEGLKDFTFPVLVQEYLNHNATIEKVPQKFSLIFPELRE